jgi:hypothetical protein
MTQRDGSAKMRIQFQGDLRFVTCIIVLLSVALAGCARNSHLNKASEDPQAVQMIRLKGFGGPLRYLGDEAGFSYFKAGRYAPKYFKVPTTKLTLRNRFPLGRQPAYEPALEEVWPR